MKCLRCGERPYRYGGPDHMGWRCVNCGMTIQTELKDFTGWETEYDLGRRIVKVPKGCLVVVSWKEEM